jgi:hypothetical protein
MLLDSAPWDERRDGSAQGCQIGILACGLKRFRFIPSAKWERTNATEALSRATIQVARLLEPFGMVWINQANARWRGC